MKTISHARIILVLRIVHHHRSAVAETPCVLSNRASLRAWNKEHGHRWSRKRPGKRAGLQARAAPDRRSQQAEQSTASSASCCCGARAAGGPPALLAPAPLERTRGPLCTQARLPRGACARPSDPPRTGQGRGCSWLSAAGPAGALSCDCDGCACAGVPSPIPHWMSWPWGWSSDSCRSHTCQRLTTTYASGASTSRSSARQQTCGPSCCVPWRQASPQQTCTLAPTS